MKTSVMEVDDLLSALSVAGVEARIGEVPGVESATVNHANKTATVRYDETRLDVAGIKSAVRQQAYQHEDAAPPKAAHQSSYSRWPSDRNSSTKNGRGGFARVGVALGRPLATDRSASRRPRRAAQVPQPW